MASTAASRSIADIREHRARHARWAIAAMLAVGWLSAAAAQDTQTAADPPRPVAPPPPPTPVAPIPTAEPSGPLNVADIMAMHQAGLGDEVIIASLRQHSMAATLGVSELISMKRHGISNEVIQAMQQTAPLPPAKPAARLASAPTVRTTVVQPTIVEPLIVSPIYRPVYRPPVIYTCPHWRSYHRYRHHAPVRSSFGIHVRF